MAVATTRQTVIQMLKEIQTDTKVLGGMQLWHLIAIIVMGICVLLTIVCCFLDWRIPRTRKEIELDRELRRMAEQYAEQMMDKMKLEDAEAHLGSNNKFHKPAPPYSSVLGSQTNKTAEMETPTESVFKI